MNVGNSGFLKVKFSRKFLSVVIVKKIPTKQFHFKEITVIRWVLSWILTLECFAQGIFSISIENDFLLHNDIKDLIRRLLKLIYNLISDINYIRYHLYQISLISYKLYCKSKRPILMLEACSTCCLIPGRKLHLGPTVG